MDKFNIFYILTILGLLLLNCNGAYGAPNQDDLRINAPERLALKMLRSLIENELTHDYMKKDVYLIKWLKSSGMSVNDAADKLKKMIKWRTENAIDNLDKEDFSWFIREFPFSMDGVDYIGRPVGTADISDWDARKVIITGRREQAIRFIFHVAEIAVKKVISAYDSGYNVSSGIVVANLDGFNTVQHACGECMPIYQNLLHALDSYYPKMIYKVVLINTPMTFYPIFRLLSPLVGRSMRDSIKIFGTDKFLWQPYLLNLIPPDQLEPQFGGTKKTINEINDINLPD